MPTMKLTKLKMNELYEGGQLDLSLCGLEEVPVREIAGFPKAVILDLSSNHLTSIGINFATSLLHLTKLDLCQNRLTELPENFGLLVNLKHLDLYRNQLETLPLSIGNLKSLRWLDLKENPLVPKLAEVAGPCLDSLQCQAAAKNIVKQYGAMLSEVEAERARRQDERQKKSEMTQIEEKEQKPKKKKKKKAAKDQPEEINTKNCEFPVPEVEDKEEFINNENIALKMKQKSLFSFVRTVGAIISRLIKYMLITSMVFLFCLFVLSMIDEDLYGVLRVRMRRATQSVVSLLPRTVVGSYNRAMLVTIKYIHQLFQLSANTIWQTQSWFVRLLTDRTFEAYLESVKSVWHILWIKIGEIYRTITLSLPLSFLEESE